MRLPKKISIGEETLALHLRGYGILAVREHQFDMERKWKFDFAIPSEALGIEVEGGTWSGGRHTRGKGYERDCQKYNAATLHGWKVLRFTTEMVKSGEAIDTIRRVLKIL